MTLAHGVRRDGEADADVAAAGAAGLDLRVDADDVAAESSSSGPPELPGLIGASVWITLSISKPLGAWMRRPRPDTMPSVAVRSSPNGLPIAIAVSPIWTLRESANGSGLADFGALPGCEVHDGEVAGGVDAEHLAVEVGRRLRRSAR